MGRKLGGRAMAGDGERRCESVSLGARGNMRGIYSFVYLGLLNGLKLAGVVLLEELNALGVEGRAFLDTAVVGVGSGPLSDLRTNSRSIDVD